MSYDGHAGLLIQELASGTRCRGVFRQRSVQSLVIDVLERRLKIERVVRRAADDDCEDVAASEIIQWHRDLVELVERPWGLAVMDGSDAMEGMTPHEEKAHASTMLNVVLSSMSDSYRSDRITKAREG